MAMFLKLSQSHNWDVDGVYFLMFLGNSQLQCDCTKRLLLIHLTSELKNLDKASNDHWGAGFRRKPRLYTHSKKSDFKTKTKSG